MWKYAIKRFDIPHCSILYIIQQNFATSLCNICKLHIVASARCKYTNLGSHLILETNPCTENASC